MNVQVSEQVAEVAALERHLQAQQPLGIVNRRRRQGVAAGAAGVRAAVALCIDAAAGVPAARRIQLQVLSKIQAGKLMLAVVTSATQPTACGHSGLTGFKVRVAGSRL